MRHGWVFMGEPYLFLLTEHPVIFGAHPPLLIVLQVLKIESLLPFCSCSRRLFLVYFVFKVGIFVFMPPIDVYHSFVFPRCSMYKY